MTQLSHNSQQNYESLMKKTHMEDYSSNPSELLDHDVIRDLEVLEKPSAKPAKVLHASDLELPEYQPASDDSDNSSEDSSEVDDETASMLYTEFVNVLHWTIPGRSGLVLSGIFLVLEMSSHYSLLYFLAGLFTIATGFNLILVNAANLLRTTWTGLSVKDFNHLYHTHITSERFNCVPRDLVEYYLHKCLDVLEILVQKSIKIILVEDQKVTSTSFFIALFTYYTAGLFSVKRLIELVVVGLFTIPYYYRKHPKTVDNYLNWIQKKQSTILALITYYSSCICDQTYTICLPLYNFIKQFVAQLTEVMVKTTKPVVGDSPQKHT